MAKVTVRDTADNNGDFKKADAFANIIVPYVDEDGEMQEIRLPVGAPLHADKSWIAEKLIQFANTGKTFNVKMQINSSEKKAAPKGISFIEA